MININSIAGQKFQPQLSSNETIYWAGMPNPKKIFHSDDWVAIPFSLLWTGFFVFWESGVRAAKSTFMTLWGIPFLVLGNYMVWGRFFVDAWLKRRTYYAVTNRRILLLQEAWRTKTVMMYLDSIPMIESEGTDIGTLWFGPKLPIIGSRGSRKRDMSRFSFGDIPVFADIDDVESVHKLIMDLRNETKRHSGSGDPLTYHGSE